ncbi:MAG: hypothetical protein Q8M76_19285, partial [Spirochaetaceae bacterium]|nr:hypothetical protein [Spirochaetaceae bacterium]
MAAAAAGLALALCACAVYDYRDRPACSGFELRVIRLSRADGMEMGQPISRSIAARNGEYYETVYCPAVAAGGDEAIFALVFTRLIRAARIDQDDGRDVYEGGDPDGCALGLEAESLGISSLGDSRSYYYRPISGNAPVLVTWNGAYRLGGSGNVVPIDGWTGGADVWTPRKSATFENGIAYLETGDGQTTFGLTDPTGASIGSLELGFRAQTAVMEPCDAIGLFLVGGHYYGFDPATGRNVAHRVLLEVDAGKIAANAVWDSVSAGQTGGTLVGATREGLLMELESGMRIVGEEGEIVREASFADLPAPRRLFMGPGAGGGFVVASFPSDLADSSDGASIALYDDRIVRSWTHTISVGFC